MAPVTAPATGAPRRVVSPFNPANAVTASRFLTLPPLYWAVENDHRQWAMLFILICGLLDKVDGLVARIFDCRSSFGELFDAIADGVCYGFAMLLVGLHGWAPMVPALAVVGLGVLNTGLRLIYAKRAGRAVNYKSYAMERVVGFIAFMIGFATGDLSVDFYYWGFLPLFALVVLHDAKRMLVDGIPGAER